MCIRCLLTGFRKGGGSSGPSEWRMLLSTMWSRELHSMSAFVGRDDMPEEDTLVLDAVKCLPPAVLAVTALNLLSVQTHPGLLSAARTLS